MRRSASIAALTLGAVVLGAATQANAFFVELGPSSQNFTLYGMGAYATGLGSFTVGQGDSTYDSVTNTSTFTLSGSISFGSPGYGSGSYSFVTTYLGPDSPTAGPNAPQAESNPSNPDEFFYSFLDPSTTMTLYLTGTPDGSLTLPLVTGGNFDAPGFSFAYTGGTCTGSPPACTQNDVGLTPGSSIYAPVTIFVETSGAIPEPMVWTMMVVGFAGLGATLRARRGTALAAAS